MRRFLLWLRGLLGQPQRSTLRILEEQRDPKRAIFRLQDSSIPGLCDYWRINRFSARGQFFILVLDKAQLREDLAAGRRGASRGDRLQPQFSTVADRLSVQMEAQDLVLATHYWITGWLYPRTSIDSKGRAYQSTAPGRLHVLAVDLQGAAGQFAGNRHARRIARTCAIAVGDRNPKAPLNEADWEMVIQRINWHEWLTAYAQKVIDPEHALQPLSTKKAPR